MPKKLVDWAPYLVWLKHEGFVEIDRSFPNEAGWGTVIELAGPHFSVRIYDDPFGPIASLGSDVIGWFQIADVVKHVAPEALPDYVTAYRETFPDRETAANALRTTLHKVTELFQHGDLQAFAAEMDRQREESYALLGKRVPDTANVAEHFGFKDGSEEYERFKSDMTEILGTIGNAVRGIAVPTRKKD